MADFLIRGSLEEIDPDVQHLADLEAERQFRKLILIPSESTAPRAVREALSTAFHNIYAEGYPDEATRWMTEAEILDFEARLGHYRRYSDPRYYKGVEYADLIEALARRRCAEAFASNGLTPDDLFVNVQPLSGAPANNAVYHALLQPGDTVMGMNLIHGGHLTHGSPANRSGKYYNIVHYNVSPETERIDYDEVEALAREHRPKMIIGGYSSYPWSVDWARFKEIAEAVGAYLMADIAHVAGLVAAGVYPSPIGIADVVTFTTHKTLCGPRAAVIVTHRRDLARKIDRAVFPGEQGGPHMNTIAALAVTFKLAQTESFRQLQEQIVKNCVAMTRAIEAEGLRIPFGGTDTHLSNVDCKSVVGEDGTPLSGDMAARILDLAGIVVNRQTIPGDTSALHPTGIRLGSVWVTQRGMTEEGSAELGRLIARVLKASRPYSQAGRRRPESRAKIDFETLNEVRLRVRDIAASLGIDYEPQRHGYPHFYYLDDPVPEAPYTALELHGDQAEALLRWVTTARPEQMAPGETLEVSLQGVDRSLPATLTREAKGWRLAVPREHAAWALTWLRDLSDGFVLLDPQDVHRKAPGPVRVRLAGGLEAAPASQGRATGEDKPWYVGAGEGGAPALPLFEWDGAEPQELRRTPLYETHRSLGAKMVPFAGWEMPVWYTSVLEEHRAVRQAAGLFDVSHMGVFQVEGDGAAAFLDSVTGNDVAALEVGRAQYTHFLDPQGNVLDDAMVYRRAPETYMVVVNAANNDKMWAWLNGVREGRYRVDDRRPGAVVFGRDCRLRDLRSPDEDERRVDLALQGPKSLEVLLALGCDEATRARLEALPWAGVTEARLGGFDLVVSRTGYTGERVAYELFVDPEEAPALWQALLEVGQPLGLRPAGLGARDSLRTEAGLPLYGQEFAGPLGLTVGEAGFAAYVKTYKPWFVGRAAFLAQEANRTREVVRFRFRDKGVRMAHTGDPVVDGRGRVIGFVTSCAVDSEGFLLGQAVVDRRFTAEGTEIGVVQGAAQGLKEVPREVRLGERLPVATPAVVLSRFPR